MPNDKNSNQFERHKIARKIYRRHLEKKFKLPASFDDCLAYFTGYRKSRVHVDSAEYCLKLAGKCIDYCDAMNDKESMQLLMYAVLKRTNPSVQYVRLGQEYNLMVLIDFVLGDVSGIYEYLKEDQRPDLAKLFHGLLKCFEETKLHLINYKVITVYHGKSHSLKNIALWKEIFSDTDSKNNSVSFTRGGGLYHFLDLKKGITPGKLDDSETIRCIYVTPEQKKNRDELYAYDSGRCRMFFDKPCRQTGKIDAKYLLSTNNNDYEAIIATPDIAEIQHLRITLFSESYKDMNNNNILSKSYLEKIIPKYIPNADKRFLERLAIVQEVSSQSKGERKQKLDTLLKRYHETRDRPQFNG